MALGKEIKVVLSLDDNGFSVKIRKAKGDTQGLSTSLTDLSKTADGVESSLGKAGAGVKGFGDSFSALQKSITSTVETLQKGVMSSFDTMSRSARESTTDAQRAATAQIDAKKRVLQNEIDVNKKLIEARAKSFGDLRKAQNDANTRALQANMQKDARMQAYMSAPTGSSLANHANMTADVAALNQQIALHEHNAIVIGLEAIKVGEWIAAERQANVVRHESVAALNAERTAALQDVAAKEQLAKISAAVGKSNDNAIRKLKADAAVRDAQASRDERRQADDTAKYKYQLVQQEARQNLAAENEKRRAAIETARIQRREAAEAAAAQRREAQSIMQMWKGMGQMYAGAKIEGGIKNSVNDADDDQRARIAIQSMNLSKTQEAKLFADSQKMSDTLGFLSTKDAIKSKGSAISSLGYNHEEVIDATLPTAIKAANNLDLLGAGHGDLQSTLRNIYGVTEMRQQTADSEAMMRTFDVLNKSAMGTAGKVTLADVENVLRRIGSGGAKQLSDDGLVNLVGLVDQFKVSGGDGGSGGGVSTVGTIIKMMQAYATGKSKSNKAVQESIGAGILDEGGLDLSKDDAHVLKEAKNGSFKNVDLWLKDPVKAIQQIVPQIVEYTKKHKDEFYQQGRSADNVDDQMTAVQVYLQKMGITQSAVSAVTAVGTPAARERLAHQSETINNSDGVDALAKRLEGSYANNVKAFGAQLTNLKVIIGDTVLPFLTKLLEYGSKVVMMFRDFGQNNPVAATLSVIGAAFGGVVLSLKGFLSMFGSLGVTGLLRSLIGIAPAAAGSAGMVATALGLMGKAFKTLAVAIIAYDVGTAIGNWLDKFDAFGAMSITLGDHIDNIITNIVVGWKELMLNGERAIAWAKNKTGILSDDEYAKKTTDIDARYDTVKRRQKSTIITAESKNRQPAKLTKERPKKEEVGEAADQPNKAVVDRLNNAVDKSGKKREDRDPLNEALEQEKGKMNAAGVKLKSLVAGGETLESLRQQAIELVEGKRLADDYSPNHDKKHRPGADDKRIVELKEATYQAMLYNEQVKAMTYANERVSATNLEANSAMNTLEAGGLAKETDAFKALSKEMARTEERLGAGVEAFGQWNLAKSAALYNQARTDTTTFALGYVDKNRDAAAALLETDRARIAATLAAQRAAEDEQINMRQKNLARTYNAEKEALEKVKLLKLEKGETAQDGGIYTEEERTNRLIALEENYQRTREDTEKVYAERRAIRAQEEVRAMESSTAKMTREWKDVSKAVDDIGAKAGNSFVEMLSGGFSNGRAKFGEFLKGILADITNAKLKQTIADPVNSAVSQGTDWVKENVFGAKKAVADEAAAAASTARTTADTAATTATGALGTVIMGQVLPALEAFTAKLAISAASSSGSEAGGIFGMFGGSGGGGEEGGGGTDWSAIGLMAAETFMADGGIMTSMGKLPLRKYATGGIARSPQVTVHGEAGPEAYVPLPDGRTIPVTMKGGGGSQQQVGVQPVIQVNVINQTSSPVNAQQNGARFDGKQTILDVVLSAVSQPGSFRSGMKEAMKGT